jgi:V/A-type H+-transporting ATPase subunit K
VALLAGALVFGFAAFAGESGTITDGASQESVYRTVGLGAAAAFAVAIGILGAGHAVGRIGAAALGAAAEKPELLTRSILFVALAEGLAILGFAIAMMLVQKI